MGTFLTSPQGDILTESRQTSDVGVDGALRRAYSLLAGRASSAVLRSKLPVSYGQQPKRRESVRFLSLPGSRHAPAFLES